MQGECVVVLGAGATKACGGPLTNEILPLAFANADEIERKGFVDLAARFIRDVFGVDPHPAAIADSQRIPSLTLVLSIIDIALDRREALSPQWQQGTLTNVRQAFDYIIFAVLERHLLRIAHNVHVDLFERLLAAYGDVSIYPLTTTLLHITR